MKVLIKSLEELAVLAKNLERAIGPGRTIALIGTLGAGKTTFAKYFLRAAGIREHASSPTFVLMHAYQKGRKAYYHIDLYRTKGYKEVQALGIPELWIGRQNTLLIEWADKIRRYLPKNTVTLKFEVKGSSREIEILNSPKKMAKMTS